MWQQLSGILTSASLFLSGTNPSAPGFFSTGGCPDYTDFSATPQGHPSKGPLRLPYMRPSEECRTFSSPAVQKVIEDMKARLRDPDMARLFENTFPNTLDTTVKYFDPEKNLAFIVTGVRNQFAHLHKLLPQDENLQKLVKAVINTEARYIMEYPYCGAFQPPPESGLKPTVNVSTTAQAKTHAELKEYGLKVDIFPPVDNQTVFECKYELDSLGGFLKLSRSYYENTKDSSFINENWNAAMHEIFQLMHNQSLPSFDENGVFKSYYTFTGTPGSLSPPVVNGGHGAPKAYTGLVATSHRPSDDLSVFHPEGIAYLIPANAMLSVELGHIASMLEDLDTLKNVSTKAKQWSTGLRKAIYDTAITSEGIFAYETDGYGSQYIMDDANVPSLLSLPYLGFVNKNDETYKKTKSVLLSKRNPYFAETKAFSGIGGPHVNAHAPWPMSQLSAIYGTDDDEEIVSRLNLVARNTLGLGLIHESIDVYDPSIYSRPWFAWANSYFAETLLDLAERKPHLIFKTNDSYVIGQTA